MTIITITSIIAAVCDYYGYTSSEIRSPSRQRPVTRARHVVCYLAKEYTNKSYPYIARMVGRKDHSTIMNACKVIAYLDEKDAEMQADLRYLRATLEEEDQNSIAAADHLAALERRKRIDRVRNYLEKRRRREDARSLHTLDDIALLDRAIQQYNTGRAA